MSWSSWDAWLLAIAMYVAVLSLVRLMLANRDALAGELQRDLNQERDRLTAEKAKAEKEKKKAAKPAPAGRRAA